MIDRKYYIGIVGSREYPRLDVVERDVVKLISEYGPDNLVIVSGGADGPDTVAYNTAKSLGCETLIFKPDWTQFKKAAGPIRNEKIVIASDKVIAYYDGKSPGTLSTINWCKHYKVFCEVILPWEV